MHKGLLGAALLLAAVVNGQQKFTVKGTVASGHPATQAVIGYAEKDVYVTDTAAIIDGAFSFRGAVSRPPLAQVTLLVPRMRGEKPAADDGTDQSPKNMALFYPEGEMFVSFNASGIAKVSGGGKEDKAHQAFTLFGKANEQKGDKALPFDRMVAAFIKTHPDAYISLDLLEMFAGAIQPVTFEPMLQSLSPRMRNTEKAKRWKQQLELAKKFDIGQPSIDFTLTDTAGNPVSLSSLKGRYVLLDFWASWCGPCRAGHPELINTYNKFKGEEFEILAVSLDNSKSVWLKAIAEDGLPWKQVSDLKGASSGIAKTYNISQIPQNLLIDPKGVIAGRNLMGKSLDEKLAELLGNKK